MMHRGQDTDALAAALKEAAELAGPDGPEGRAFRARRPAGRLGRCLLCWAASLALHGLAVVAIGWVNAQGFQPTSRAQILLPQGQAITAIVKLSDWAPTPPPEPRRPVPQPERPLEIPPPDLETLETLAAPRRPTDSLEEPRPTDPPPVPPAAPERMISIVRALPVAADRPPPPPPAPALVPPALEPLLFDPPELATVLAQAQPVAPQPTEPSTPDQSTEPAAPAAVASGVQQGVRVANCPAPEYPAVSRRRGEEGQVEVRVLVLPDGSADQVDFVCRCPYSLLNDAALEAARRAVFVPARVDGKPVAAYIVIPFRFELN